MVLSVDEGHDVGYLTKAVAQGRESYYTGAVAVSEPPGLWYGAGAEKLGLRGEVDADLMEVVYSHLRDPRDPATHNRETWADAPALAKAHRKYRSADEVYAGLLDQHPGAGAEERAALRVQAERSARQAVAFYDVTFSAPKSVTVLGVAFERAANHAAAAGDHEAAAAWSAHAKAVEEAVLAGARAAVDYLQDVAGYSRVGHHGCGGGQWIDAHEFVVAQFLQHDSRDRDPQWHVHQAILNRVLCSDGVWRALDGKAIRAARAAAGAIAERVMEAHLARTVGARVETRADGKAREVVGVDRDVLDLFSSRSKAIEPRVAQLVGPFDERFGRPPSPYERAVIAQQVTLATRRPKSHEGETVVEQLDRWEAMARTRVAGGLAPIAREVLARGQQAGPAAEFSPLDVVERAVATVGDNRQHYTYYDLLKAVSDALPGHLDVGPDEVLPLLQGLTEAAVDLTARLTPEPDETDLPDELRLANGHSVFGRPGSVRYASAGQLAAEQAEAAAARARLADTLTGRESLLMVGTNAAAARISAALRAELVTLGQVALAGVALGRDGWQGVVAGVGDLVQARRNGWELTNFAGNTRAPINAETYRVTALRPDGSLTVAPILRRAQPGDADGEKAGDQTGSAVEVLGEPIALPASYVAADVTLAYASTVHAAEGRSVDTSYNVVGARTDLAGLLVADDPRPRGEHRLCGHPRAARRRADRPDPRRRAADAAGGAGRRDGGRPRGAVRTGRTGTRSGRGPLDHDPPRPADRRGRTGHHRAHLDRAGPAGRRGPAHPAGAGRSWPPTTPCGRWSGCCAPRGGRGAGLLPGPAGPQVRLPSAVDRGAGQVPAPAWCSSRDPARILRRTRCWCSSRA